MADLDTIVKVNISADSRTPSAQGFGVTAVVTNHALFDEDYRKYSSASEMKADGFDDTYPALLKVRAIFDQDPAPEYVIVARLPAAPTFVNTIQVLTSTTGKVLSCQVIDDTGTVQLVTRTVPTGSSLAAEATAMASLLGAVSGVTSAVAAGDTVTVTHAGRRLWFYNLQNVGIAETTADANYDDFLTSLLVETDEFYFVVTDSGSAANLTKVAQWALANKRFYFAEVQSSNLLTGSGSVHDAIVAEKAAGNDRFVVINAADPSTCLDSGWVGVGSAKTPGFITWAYKEIKGGTPKNLTTTEKSNLEAINVNHYQVVRGLAVTRPGKCVNGEWIDVRHGLDALESALQEEVFGLIAQKDKVPFTASGLDLIASHILAVLQRFEGTAEQPGLIAVGTSWVKMPSIKSLSASDISNRKLKGVKFGGILAGAIHYVEIDGSLTNT